MGAVQSSLHNNSWEQLLRQPIVLTTAAVIICTAAWVFHSLLTKKGFRGSYSAIAKDLPRAKNESTSIAISEVQRSKLLHKWKAAEYAAH